MRVRTGLGVVFLVAAVMVTSSSAQVGGGPPADQRDRGDVLEQLELARQAYEATGGDAERYEYAKLLMESGSFERAREMVSPLVAVPEPPLDALRLAAKLAYFVGDYGDAERLFSDLVTRDPGNPKAVTGLVLTFYQTNAFGKCRDFAQSLGGEIRLPVLDLMVALGGDDPYVAEWADGPYAEVPFVASEPLPVIEVEVNGRKVAAIIDTGADLFILDSEVAAEMGIEQVASARGMFAGGLQADIGFGRAETLTLGGVTLHSVPISLLPTKALSLGGVEIGGIVGTSVLRQFLSTIDYPEDRLVLRERSASSVASFLSENEGRIADDVPFYLQGTHFILTHGSLNGHEGLLFHVDSGLAGLPSFAAPEQTLRYVGIPVPEVAVREDVMGGGGGGFAVGEFDIESLGLGSLVQHDLVGSFGGTPPGSYWGLGFILDGLISHNFLKAYAWTIDFDGMRVWFTQA